MKLPVQIQPDPLVTTSVELRFPDYKDANQLPAIILPLFSSELPEIKPNNIPKEFRQADANLLYQSDFAMSNERFSFGFGSRSILFETLGEYPLWPMYFDFIKRTVSKLHGIGLINEITRIGLRYASIFDQPRPFNQILNFVPKLNIPGYQDTTALLRSDLEKNGVKFIVQTARQATSRRRDSVKEGVLIDIDAYHDSSVFDLNQIIDIVDKLHSEEKRLFYTFLHPDFLQTLNPTYK